MRQSFAGVHAHVPSAHRSYVDAECVVSTCGAWTALHTMTSVTPLVMQLIVDRALIKVGGGTDARSTGGLWAP